MVTLLTSQTLSVTMQVLNIQFKPFDWVNMCFCGPEDINRGNFFSLIYSNQVLQKRFDDIKRILLF